MPLNQENDLVLIKKCRGVVGENAGILRRKLRGALLF
jgi:hypothetical protein